MRIISGTQYATPAASPAAVFGVTAFGILILTMLKTGVSQYRAMCWHAADPTKMHARTHTGNNMRIFLMIVVIFKTVGFAAMLQTVVRSVGVHGRPARRTATQRLMWCVGPTFPPPLLARPRRSR